MRACLLVSCFLALFLPFARLPLFCFGVGLTHDKLRGSLARLRRLRPDTFTLSTAVVFFAAGVLLISAAVPLPTKTVTAGTLFLLAVSGNVTVRETEGIYIALSLGGAGIAFFLAVCLTAKLSQGFAAFFCVLLVFAAWEQKNSLAAVFCQTVNKVPDRQKHGKENEGSAIPEKHKKVEHLPCGNHCKCLLRKRF